MSLRRDIGDRAERLAAEYLVEAGYTVVDQNWSCPLGELDLVVTHGELLAFVEVRSTSSRFLAGPELTVNERKQAKVARAAELWMNQREHDWRYIRFDVIAVRFRLGMRASIKHIEDAFLPPWAI